jgi:hypothetical protein
VREAAAKSVRSGRHRYSRRVNKKDKDGAVGTRRPTFKVGSDLWSLEAEESRAGVGRLGHDDLAGIGL